MLRKYVVPNTNVVIILPGNILATSDPKKDFGSSTFCPFNGLWCKDKQQRLNKRREAAQYFAKTHTNHVFHTNMYDAMFDGCPHHYSELCQGHKQKQRG